MNNIVAKHPKTNRFQKIKNTGIEFKIDKIQRKAFTYIADKHWVVNRKAEKEC